MTIARKKPLVRKSAKKRTYKTPRCDVRGCRKPQDVKWIMKTTEDFEGVAVSWNGDEPTIERYEGRGPWHYFYGMCKSHAKAEADRRFSHFIRQRDGKCRIRTVTPCVGPLSCCHLLSRRFLATRWDEENAVAGCAGHHSYWTRNPDKWSQFLEIMIGVDRLNSLRNSAFCGAPMDLADVLARYPAVPKKDEGS